LEATPLGSVCTLYSNCGPARDFQAIDECQSACADAPTRASIHLRVPSSFTSCCICQFTVSALPSKPAITYHSESGRVILACCRPHCIAGRFSNSMQTGRVRELCI